ncbi:MAG: YtxH domain-containing protein, partial [Gemmatimonadota bacterium]
VFCAERPPQARAGADPHAGTRIAPSAATHIDTGAVMYYDEESSALSFVAGMLLGAAVGASLALLTAPQSGRKTRKRLIRGISTARDAAGDQWEDLADEVQGVVRKGRKRIRL